MNDFAYLSGDYNPIHINEQYALNSFFRHTIVYGILQVFLAMEKIKYSAPFSIHFIKAKFLAPIPTHHNFQFQIHSPKLNEYKITISTKEQIYTEISLSLALENSKQTFIFQKTTFSSSCNECLSGGGGR